MTNTTDSSHPVGKWGRGHRESVRGQVAQCCLLLDIEEGQVRGRHAPNAHACLPFDLGGALEVEHLLLGKSVQLQENVVGKHVKDLLQRPGTIWSWCQCLRRRR